MGGAWYCSVCTPLCSSTSATLNHLAKQNSTINRKVENVSCFKAVPKRFNTLVNETHGNLKRNLSSEAVIFLWSELDTNGQAQTPSGQGENNEFLLWFVPLPKDQATLTWNYHSQR